ncbi:universal stress protein [Aliikangiella sp. IMCC44632]
MQSINKILVVAEPERDSQHAIERATYLAKAFNAQVHLFACVYNRSLSSNILFNQDDLETAKKAYVAKKLNQFKEYETKLAEQNISVSSHFIWHKESYDCINQEATAVNADLIIKATYPHAFLKRVLFTPNDWQLLKTSKIPLILAKQSKSNQYNNLLAAIDPSLSRNKPKGLNDRILTTTHLLKLNLAADAYVLNCVEPMEYQVWSDMGAGVGVGMGPTDFAIGEDAYLQYVNDLKASFQQAFDNALSNYQFDDDKKLLIQGYPESVLPEFVQQNGIDLLVLGTVYRTGLIGSTAERVLDDIQCDILSVQVADGN